jgi:diacylglycerol O-acyltransferase / wax synthase
MQLAVGAGAGGKVGVLLLLDTGPGFDVAAAERALGGRVCAVPRLRQRLYRAPPGCGRPYWADDPAFDVRAHVRRVCCPPPGDERALLDVAAAELVRPLPRSRPLWSAAFVTGLADGGTGLVIVVNHVLADGVAGLAVLAALLDQPAPTAAAAPAPAPTTSTAATPTPATYTATTTPAPTATAPAAPTAPTSAATSTATSTAAASPAPAATSTAPTATAPAAATPAATSTPADRGEGALDLIRRGQGARDLTRRGRGTTRTADNSKMRDFPVPPPSLWALAADAWAGRVCRVARPLGGLRRLRQGIAELGGARPPRRLAPTSLNQPTGPRRRLDVVSADLAAVRKVAHAHGGTVNDVVLGVVAGALRDLLASRGERLREVTVSVPVSARQATGAEQLGNQIGVMSITVPADGDLGGRVSRIAAITRERKSHARGASATVFVPGFLLLARIGLLDWFDNHQRFVHTFVTNLRGPGEHVTFAGAPVRAVVAIPATTGNVTVTFAALSWAGTLRITVLSDPGRVPDAPLLAAALRRALNAVGVARHGTLVLPAVTDSAVSSRVDPG